MHYTFDNEAENKVSIFLNIGIYWHQKNISVNL